MDKFFLEGLVLGVLKVKNSISSFKKSSASFSEQDFSSMIRSMVVPPFPNPKSYHKFLDKETLNEACVSERKGLRNQACFSEVLVGRCPNLANVLTRQILRAVSKLKFFSGYSIYSLVYLQIHHPGRIEVSLMTKQKLPLDPG